MESPTQQVVWQQAVWQRLQHTLTALRAEEDRFEQAVTRQCDELDQVRHRLLEQEAEIGRQRQSVESELTQSRNQLARFATVAVELADARQTIAQLRQDLYAETAARHLAEKQQEEQQQQSAQLQQERQRLEHELDDIRQRMDEQRRRVAEERAEWVGELLRSALDVQSHLMTDAELASLKVVSDDANRTPGGTGGRTPTTSDPVVGAVMAQFELLQQERERANAAGRARGGNRHGVA